MKRITTAALLLPLLSLNCIANEFDFAISDEFIQATLQSSADQRSRNQLSLMHADSKGNSSDLVSFGLFASGSNDNINTNIGGKAFALYSDGNNIRGIALGGSVEMMPAPKVSIAASAYYAPDIVTGGDFENYQEFDARVGYQILDNASIFIGYRFMEVKNDQFEFEPYKGGFLGLKFTL
jgi:predicted porin